MNISTKWNSCTELFSRKSFYVMLFVWLCKSFIKLFNVIMIWKNLNDSAFAILCRIFSLFLGFAVQRSKVRATRVNTANTYTYASPPSITLGERENARTMSRDRILKTRFQSCAKKRYWLSLSYCFALHLFNISYVIVKNENEIGWGKILSVRTNDNLPDYWRSY